MRLLNLLFVWLIFFNSLLFSEIPIKTVLPIKIFISVPDNIYRTDDDIILNVEVYNTSEEPVSFYKSDNKLNNFKISILNLNNASLMTMKDINYNTTFYKREYTIFPDEIYKVRINLKDYFNFTEKGRYKIKVEFDPYLSSSSIYSKYISNSVYLTLKPSLKKEQENEYIMSLIQKEKEKVYTPEMTVTEMLEAQKNHNWEGYFRYQNLRKIILQYSYFKKKFLKASEVMKEKIINDFKNYIKTRKDYEIENYEITKVVHYYTTKTSTVECIISYKKPAIYKKFTYKFYLKQDGNKWIVEDYDAISYIKRVNKKRKRPAKKL